MINKKKWNSISITFIKGSIITFIITLFLSTIIVIILNFMSIYYWIKVLLMIIISIIIIESFIQMSLSKLIYKNIRFRMNDDFFIFKKGIIFKREILIPFNKIYQIKRKKGPIENLLNVYSLEIITAVSSLNIKYIDFEETKIIERHIKKSQLKGDDFFE